jgi:hypothetical protein
MRPLRECLLHYVIAIRPFELHLLDPQSEVSSYFEALIGSGLSVLDALDCPALAQWGGGAIGPRSLCIFFVKGVIVGLVAQDVSDQGGHAALALELGTLDALETLSVGFLSEDLLLVRQHNIIFYEKENTTK